MRRKKGMVLLFGIMLLAACGSMGTSENGTAPMEETLNAATVESEEMGALNKTDNIMEEVINTNVREELVIYYGNVMDDGLETEIIPVEEITPEIIISYLMRRNIVSVDTKVNGFEITQEDGRNIINLNLSKAFGEYLGTMEPDGEAVIMTALTNTFLTAYEADAIRITVEGESIQTDCAVYAEPLSIG